MKWNPKTLRWEGNENALSAFDAPIAKSIRPALITQLTGSIMGSPTCRSTPGARKVGNMIFDPSRMCWISDAQDDEVDVFADFADDENDWDSRGSTIRTSSVTAPSPVPTHERTISESSSDRGSRASLVYDVDSAFLERCHAAEARHIAETRAWRFTTPGHIGTDHRSHLYDIRALATRQYWYIVVIFPLSHCIFPSTSCRHSHSLQTLFSTMACILNCQYISNYISEATPVISFWLFCRFHTFEPTIDFLSMFALVAVNNFVSFTTYSTGVFSAQ